MAGSLSSSQDQRKGVPFPSKPIVSDGLEITGLSQGSGQSSLASENRARVIRPTNCQDKIFGWSHLHMALMRNQWFGSLKEA